MTPEQVKTEIESVGYHSLEAMRTQRNMYRLAFEYLSERATISEMEEIVEMVRVERECSLMSLASAARSVA